LRAAEREEAQAKGEEAHRHGGGRSQEGGCELLLVRPGGGLSDERTGQRPCSDPDWAGAGSNEGQAVCEPLALLENGDHAAVLLRLLDAISPRDELPDLLLTDVG